MHAKSDGREMIAAPAFQGLVVSTELAIIFHWAANALSQTNGLEDCAISLYVTTVSMGCASHQASVGATQDGLVRTVPRASR